MTLFVTHHSHDFEGGVSYVHVGMVNVLDLDWLHSKYDTVDMLLTLNCLHYFILEH